MAKIGIIGGSGLYEIDGMANVEEVNMNETPFGLPSDSFMTGTLEGTEVVFLARHGRGHRVSPSELNYRANIYGMKKLGVEAIISVSACGSLREEMKPLDFVVPDQFVDRTNKTRESSFFTDGIVAHVAFADPFAEELRVVLIASAKEVGATVHPKGTYIVIEGPQFSTKAESNLYRSWGMDIIGMTNLTEAKLAREAEISYATLAAVTDYDCWHEAHDTVTVEMIIDNLQKNAGKAKEILKNAIPRIGALKEFSASEALKYALITDRSMIPEDTKKKLEPIIGKYLNG
ncbi:MAG: S-methyl-5'-thioadenosine phosphorylase [Candidatus Omnitrophica bacterium]|nr:S-methyl-5'-thioadenosine phosphorylase [Candidatus Omnitrophota bacterium]